MDESDILIIGAGIAGLLCGRTLADAGREVRILDKGRGFGGRMATRRMGNGRIDHGAQYFTARDPRFRALVEDWLEAGVIREWFRHLPEDNHPAGYPRYCGVHGMTDLPKHLATGLDVRRSERVESLRREGGRWIAQSAEGREFSAKMLVVTAPLPQALDVLETSGEDFAGADLAALRAVCYEKGLAVLALLDGPSGLPGFGGLKLSGGPLTWIADNQLKGISPEAHTVTLHAAPDYAEAHWDSDDAVRVPPLLEAAGPHLRSAVLEHSAHRWGFAFPCNPWRELLFANDALNLVLAGDAFGGPRIEGAALSGLAAADRILSNS